MLLFGCFLFLLFSIAFWASVSGLPLLPCFSLFAHGLFKDHIFQLRFPGQLSGSSIYIIGQPGVCDPVAWL